MLANIGATSLDPGIRLMNVSHAQYVIWGGKKSSIIWEVFFFFFLTSLPVSPWMSSSSDGLTHSPLLSAYLGALCCTSSHCGANSTNQPASSCRCLCRRPPVFSCGARDLHRALCHLSGNINREEELRACLETPRLTLKKRSIFASPLGVLWSGSDRHPAGRRNLRWSSQPVGDSVTAVYVCPIIGAERLPVK